MSQDCNSWVKVTLDGKEVAVYHGTEAIQLFSARERENLRKGNLALLVDGRFSNPEYVIERNCELELKERAEVEGRLADTEVILAAPDEINNYDFEATLIREGAMVSRARFPE